MRLGVVIIDVVVAEARRPEMYVHVDQPRQQRFARAVDDLRVRRRGSPALLADLDDPPAAHEHAAVFDDPAVADEHAHVLHDEGAVAANGARLHPGFFETRLADPIAPAPQRKTAPVPATIHHFARRETMSSLSQRKSFSARKVVANAVTTSATASRPLCQSPCPLSSMDCIPLNR